MWGGRSRRLPAALPSAAVRALANPFGRLTLLASHLGRGEVLLASPSRSICLLLSSPFWLGAAPCVPDDELPEDEDPTPAPALRLDVDDPLVTSESGLEDSFTLRLGSSPGAELVVVEVESPDPSEWALRAGEGDPIEATIRTADTLSWQEDIVLRYPHIEGGITGDFGLHLQGYHFDGTHHYSTGGDKGQHGWVFVNHAGGGLQCASHVAHPFETDKVHPGGGWFLGGRFYTPVSNEKEGDGRLALLSFAPAAACDAADSPDAVGTDGLPACACDVRWVQGADGTTLVHAPDEYMGLGLLLSVAGEDRAVVYSTTGSNPWVCEPDGTGCQDMACFTGESACTEAEPAPPPESDNAFPGCGTDSVEVCPQECFGADGFQICSDFPRIGAGDAWLYLFDGDSAEAIGDFQDPDDRILLPLSEGGAPTNPEGVALHEGLLYLAGDHQDGSGGNCGAFSAVSPCTNADGDQVVRVYTPATTKAQLVFDSDNWNDPQTVTVAGLDDALTDGDVEGLLGLSVYSNDPAWAALDLGDSAIAALNVDNEGPSPPLSLTSAAPAHGPHTGGTEVELSGEGMAGVQAVWFDDAPASVLAAWQTRVAVLAPSNPAGPVSIRALRADGAEDTLAAAFEYFTDASGQYSGLLRSWLISYDPAWFWIGSPYGAAGSTYLQVDSLFHQPIASELTLFGAGASPGECSGSGAAEWTNVSPGPSIELWSPQSGALPMSSGDGVVYWLLRDVSTPSQWGGQPVDLDVVVGGDVPAQRIVDAAWMPGWPQLPWSVSDVNHAAHGQDLELSWTSDAPIDAVTYTVHAASGTTSLGSTTCTVDGSGPLVVPWVDILGALDPAQVTHLLVSLKFRRDTEAVLGHDGSSFWGRGLIEFYFYVALDQ